MTQMIAGQLIGETETEPGVVVVNPTVTYNPSASPIEITLKEWNRDFSVGTLAEWTRVNAEITTEDPYTGDYCCELLGTGSSITQVLDEPVPVNAVYEFSAWLKNPSGTAFLYTLRMTHTDGSTKEVSGTVNDDEWERVYFARGFMDTSKILASVAVLSYSGRGWVDAVFLGLATEIITGIVESSQATPENLQGEMIARPKGGVRETASITTALAWAVVVEYVVPAGDEADWKFELAKILVSCPNDIMYRLRWNDVVISPEVYVTGGIPFTDWFPWDYENMRGDGVKAFDIQARFPVGGAAATCHAEIVGENVAYDFNL